MSARAALHSKPDRLPKSAFLEHWANLKPNQPIEPTPVPYRHEGSSYAEDGIRITGSRDFIDSVLSRIKDLLQYESDDVRLDVNYSEQASKRTGDNGKPEYGGPNGSWCCYVKVAERGHEAKHVNAFLRAFSND